jgi:alpha-mannosidase
METTLIIDPELPEAEMLETVRAGASACSPLLEQKRADHADPVCLWPRPHRRGLAVAAAGDRAQDGAHAINQLALLEEYPEFKFLQSQPHLYWMLEQRYPELYERFKAAVQGGKSSPTARCGSRPTPTSAAAKA